MMRSLLFQASISTRYWVERHHTATYLLNHLPIKALNTNSSYFALHGVAPSYEQASRACYSQFATYFTSLGFVEAKSDTSLFVYVDDIVLTDTIYLLFYIDDIVLTVSSVALLQQTISTLKRKFAMKDLGSLHHFLEVFVQHQADELFLTQRQFALNILERAGMVDCNLVSMPMDT
jgi:hypothetical protein